MTAINQILYGKLTIHHCKKKTIVTLCRCDIGGPNNSTEWQADYFNQALKSGQQVVVNDRCGDGSASDFTSVEYVAVKNAPSR